MSDTENMVTNNTLVRLIRNGPPDDAGLILHAVGMMLWWRHNAFLLLGFLPLFIGMYIYVNVDPLIGLFATWAVAIVLEPKALKLSPKYEITRNY